MKLMTHHTKPDAFQTGMTLMELLVGLALTGVVLTAVISLALKTNTSSMSLQARSELTSENQIAQNYIASKLKNAVYIFPNTATGVTYFTLATSGYSTYNPGTSNYNWRLGTGSVTADPFIAFVVPPAGGNSVSAGSCSAASAISDPDQRGNAQAMNCYAFYAYYAVPRVQLVTGGASGTAPTGPNKLAPDAANDNNVWALMEYRAYYSAQSGGGFPLGATAIPTGGTGRLVVDYVKPTTETGNDKLFITPVGSSASPSQMVTLQLATTRQIGGQQVSSPITGRNSINIYPRNINANPIVN